MKVYSIFHRVTSVLCTLALLLGMCAVPVAAADTVSVTAATGTPIKQGSTGECSVYIDSMESLASLSVTVHFDPARVKITDLYNSVDCVLYDSAENADNIQFSYILDGEGEAAKTRLFYFRYEVLSDAETGAAFFDITVSEAYDSSLNTVPVTGSRCYFNIAQAQVDKRCSVRVDKTAVSTVVEEEFSLSYSFSTHEIASGFATVTYDPELFEVVGVTNGKFLENKMADVNIAMAGSVYLSFVGTEYVNNRDVMTVTFKAIKNVTDTSGISFKVSELYDVDRNSITCPSVSSNVQIAFDPNYTGDAPTMKLNAQYDSTTDQVTAVITLEELSKLGAGDFVVEFDPKVLTLVNWKKGFNPNFFTTNDREAEKGIFKFSIVSLKDIVAAQTVLTLTFDVTYTCQDQEAVIGLSGSMLSDSLTNPIVLNIRGDKTTVPLRHYIGDWVIDPAPTCTETGLNVRKCTVCGIVLETGDVIPELGHKPVTDEAVEQDCVNTGLTEGSHCSVCHVVLVEQQVIPANGHTEGETVVENAFDPDCTNVGGYENVVYCTVCNTELSREPMVVDPLGHTEVIDEAVPYTCRETGLTEGKHCSVCNEVLIAQKVVPAAHEPDGNGLCGVCNQYVGSCGNNVKWELDAEGTLTIYGAGNMTSFSSASSVPWYSRRESVKKIVVESGVTSVGNNAFYDMANLTSVELPEGLKSIGHQGFRDCKSLTSIRLPEGLTYISSYGFYGCTSLAEVVFPKSMTSMDSYVFEDCKSLTHVELPENLTSMGNAVFRDCSNLAEVRLPEGLKTIGWSVFAGCTSLTDINMPDSLTSMGTSLFYGCSSLTEVRIPEKITKLPESMFLNCTALVNVELPTGLIGIDSNVFSGCTALVSIELPEGLTSLGSRAFMDCSGLTEIRIPDGVTVIADNVFTGCSALETAELPAALTSIGYAAFFGCKSLTAIEIPKTVTIIKGRAFYECIALAAVELPEAVTEIGESAFYGCNALTEIKIPSGVTVLTDNLFGNCLNLTRVELPEQLTKIGNLSFCNTGLTEIDLPDTVTEIGSSAFQNCVGLKEIRIPDGVTTLSTQVFYGCSALETVELPEKLEKIGYAVFEGCTSLTEIQLPEGITEIDGSAFRYCSNLAEINIPDSVTTIGSYAFENCKALTEVQIPDGVTSLAGYLFYGCSSLTSMKIGENVTRIGQRAFYGCSSLTAVTIPAKVSAIETYAFARCTNLQEIRFEGAAPEFGFYAFQNVKATAYYPYPDSSWTADTKKSYGGTLTWLSYCTGEHDVVVDARVEADCVNTGLTEGSHCAVCDVVFVEQKIIPANGHTEVIDRAVAPTCRTTGLTEGKHCSVCEAVLIAQQIIPDAHKPDESGICTVCGQYFGTCGYNAKWELDMDGTLTIYGSGNMYDYYSTAGIPWFDHLESVRKVVVEEGITYVGRNAFLRHIHLAEVSLPDSLTGIGYGVFEGCTGLVHLDIPDSVTSIGMSAFYGCSNLETVNLPENLETIIAHTFSGCTSLTEIEIPETVTSIGGSAFYNCDSLTEVRIPAGVTKIESNTFAYCDSLVKVELPEGISSIGNYAFINCGNLSEIEIPQGVTGIGGSAFQYCTSLTEIRIPDSVTSLDSYAFGGCAGLREVEIPGGIDSVGNYAFTNCDGLRRVEIADGVTGIGVGAFSRCPNLDTVHIPDSVTTLGASAFEYCTGLADIEIPNSVTAIGNGAFDHCTKLRSITLSEGVQTLGERVFAGCSQLTKIVIPSTVTSLGYRVFANCYNLREVRFMGDAPGFDSGTFGMSSPTVYYPSPNETWTEEVMQSYEGTIRWKFYCAEEHTPATDAAVAPDCTNSGLTEGSHCAVCDEILVPQEVVPANGHTEGEIVVENYKDADCVNVGGYDDVVYCTVCEVELSREHTVFDALGHTESEIIVENYKDADCVNVGGYDDVIYCTVCEVELSREHTVFDALGHTESEIIIENYKDPDCVNVGGYDDVIYCTVCEVELSRKHTVFDALGHTEGEIVVENYEDPDCVHVGGYDDVVYCTVCKVELSREHIEIPANGHTEAIDPAVDPTCRETGLTEGKHCSVCNEVLIKQNVIPDAHDPAEDGSCRVCGRIFGTCGTKAKWDLDAEGVLTVYGTGRMSGSYDEKEIPWYPYVESIKKVVVCEGITGIGISAFYNCVNLTEVSLPDSLTFMDYQAFGYCKSLTEIVIPEGVQSMYFRVFYGCSSLSKVNIPEKATHIYSNAFAECTSLTSIEIPYGMTAIDNSAFQNCSSLKKIYIPETVTQISSYVFSHCTSLTAIDLPENLEKIEAGLFYGCSGLTDVVIPEGVTQIGNYAFGYCTALTAIEIPAAVTSIGDGAFSDCTGLAHVFYQGTEAQKNEISIGNYNTPFTDAEWICEAVWTTLDSDKVCWCENCNRYYHPDGTLAPMEQVEITKLPEKLRYCTNDVLNLDGIEMIGSYSNGVELILGKDDVESVSADLSAPGRRKATVTVMGIPVVFEIIVHDDGKISVDPALYPESEHEYGNNIEESQTFTYPGAKYLEITFSAQTMVENNYDFIYIYDAQETLVAKFTNNAAANQTLIIPGDTFLVKLTSDGSVTRYGYSFSKIVVDLGTGVQHDVIVDPATVTCTEAGLTEGSHCGICGDILVAQEQVAALGHDMTAWDILEESTCTTTGLQRRECNRCGHEETDVIPAKDHTEGETVVENKVEADCTNDGSYDNVTYCTACGEELSRETVVVDAKGHTEVIDKAVEADCVNTGLTEGKHCSVCDEVLVKQEVIPAGHALKEVPALDPTFETEGNLAHFSCENCGKLFADAEAETELNPEDVILEKRVGAAQINGVRYETLSEALAAVQPGDKVQMLKDTFESDVVLPKGIALDLNGHVLEADYIFAVNGANIVDESEGNTGLLKADADCVLISKANAQLPVWNGEGYVFSKVTYRKALVAHNADMVKFAFLPQFQSVATELLKDGAEGNMVTVEVRVSWETIQGREYRNLVFNNQQVGLGISSGGAFILTFSGFSQLNLTTDVAIEAVVYSETGVSVASEAIVVDVTPK